MSFNVTLGFLPNTAPSEVGASSSAGISFEDASSMMTDGPSAAAVGPHTLLVDPTMLMVETLPFVPSPGTAVVTLSGVADVYMIQIYGDSPRSRVFSEYEVAEEEGTPVAAESVFEELEDPEDAHIEFFCRVAGITMNDLWNLEWTPLAP